MAKQRPDLELYFPIKDRGVDLLAVKRNGTRPQRIQIKESRLYADKGHSWHEIRAEKIADADIFAFITYVPVIKGQKSAFEKDFAVIPAKALKKLCQGKKCSRGKFAFYFKVIDGRLHDIRDGRVNLSAYHRAWRLI